MRGPACLAAALGGAMIGTGPRAVAAACAADATAARPSE